MLVVSLADMMRGADKMTLAPGYRDIFHPCASSCNPYRCKCILQLSKVQLKLHVIIIFNNVLSRNWDLNVRISC